MIFTQEARIHGLRTSYAEDGVEVRYVSPGSLQTPSLPDPGGERSLFLGIVTADPDSQDMRDDRFWRWAPGVQPATQIWARHVLAVEATDKSMVYEHEGQVVVVWASIPGRERELELLQGGFEPALATWRAPATKDAVALATRSAQLPARTAPAAGPRTMPAELRDEADHAARAEHAWMRWAARMDTRVLKLGEQTFELQRPPRHEGDNLILRYRRRGMLLRLAFDVSRHPLIHDVRVAVGDRQEDRKEHNIAAVAWEDLEALIERIGQIVRGKHVGPAAAEQSMANSVVPIRGEETNDLHRRAEVWEAAIARVLFGFDLPESLPLYPLARRLATAALKAVDEQIARNGDDYMESLRRRDTTQTVRLAQLEQALFDTLAEARAFGGLTKVVRNVIGLADGSIHQVPAGTASEAFWRTWRTPDQLPLRGQLFTLRQNHVLFESASVELRYRLAAPWGAPVAALTLSVGLPDRRGLCAVRARLWNPELVEESSPWKLTVPQLEKLTGASIARHLKPVVTAAEPPAGDDAWEDALIAEFRAQDARDPQLRLERRLGSGARIFVAHVPGSRPEQIVARVDIDEALELDSLTLAHKNDALEVSLRRRVEAALAAVRAQQVAEEESETMDYAAARKRALTDAPRPVLVDRLAQHMARQREAAAVETLRAQARTDLTAATRTVLAMAAPADPSPSETAEWLDDHNLPNSAALLSSYIFTPTVAVEAFMADLSASLDAEMGTRPAMQVKNGTLKLLSNTLRRKDRVDYVLEAAGHRVRTHPVTVSASDDRFVYIDASQLPKGPLRDGEGRVYVDGEFSEDTIREVWTRYDGLLQSLIRAPVQLEDMRQLILLAAELVDAPRCQGTAKANAQRALEAAEAHYAGARTQLQRGRDARAIDRLRDVLRAVVQVAHHSAESCALGQTDLLEIAEISANHT